MDRENAQGLMQALQDELTNMPMKKSEESRRMNSSKKASLKSLVETRLHLYLRAENQSAIRSWSLLLTI